MHTGCYGTELPTPPPVTSLPLACAVVLATRAESRCWVPERPGGWEVTSFRGRCCLATALRLHLLPRLLLLPIPGFADFQALAGATPVLEPNRCILRWSQEPGLRAYGVGCRMRGPGARRSRGDRAGCARAWRVLGREPRGGAGDTDATWPARGALGGGRPSEWASVVERATETLMQPGDQTSLCVLFYFFVREQTNGLGKCRCCSWLSIVFEYGYMQFIFRRRSEVTLTLTVLLEKVMLASAMQCC